MTQRKVLDLYSRRRRYSVPKPPPHPNLLHDSTLGLPRKGLVLQLIQSYQRDAGVATW